MKILYVATVVKTHIMEFHIPILKSLKESGWETAVAAKNDYENKSECNIPYCDEYYDIPFARSPFSLKNIKAYIRLKKVIASGNYDIVHCHTPVGGVLTRLACRSFRKNGLKVIYTAHGFHFYKGAPLINWIMYYPIEWLCAHWTDVLITINEEDYDIAQKYMHAKNIEYVPGVGLDTVKFRDTVIDRNAKRRELGIPEDAFLILSVGELNENKNHQAVIRELVGQRNSQCPPLLHNIPIDKAHYAIAGSGPLRDNLMKLADNLGIGNRVHLLGYRSDCAELYKTADLFVLPSKREGLNVSLQEAKASGLECRCYPVRGNDDIMKSKNTEEYDLRSINERMKQIYHGTRDNI